MIPEHGQDVRIKAGPFEGWQGNIEQVMPDGALKVKIYGVGLSPSGAGYQIYDPQDVEIKVSTYVATSAQSLPSSR